MNPIDDLKEVFNNIKPRQDSILKKAQMNG